MTTPNQIGSQNKAIHERRRNWARTTLEIPLEASSDEARAHFLRAVAEHNFLPPEPWHDAWRVIEHDALPRTPDQPESFAEAEVERLNEKVRAFAERMFIATPEVRKSEFDSLRNECLSFVEPLGQLELLKKGLAVDLEVLRDERQCTRELAQHLTELFVLSPTERAGRRWSVIQEATASKTSIAEWDVAARRLQTVYPAFVALDKSLVKSILDWRKTTKSLSRPLARPTAITAARTTTPRERFSLVGLGVVLLGVCLGPLFREKAQEKGPPKLPPPIVTAPKIRIDNFPPLPKNDPPQFVIPPILRDRGFDDEKIREGIKKLDELSKKRKEAAENSRKAAEKMGIPANWDEFTFPKMRQPNSVKD